MDWVFGTFGVTVLCFLLALYSGWAYKTKNLVEEIGQGSPRFVKSIIGNLTPGHIWIFFIRFVCPIVIGLVLLDLFGVFGEAAGGG
jgi:NSS family neurotransmitter:Na+ symporter